MKKNKVLSIKYLMYDIIHLSGIPGLLWFRPKKYYLHEEDKKRIKGGALVIANHITLFDPMYLLLIIKSRRHHCICMEEMFHPAIKGWLFSKAFLCLPINREKVSFGQIKDIISHLKNGDMVTMFPEGKVNEEKEGMQSFKSGMVMMAMRGGVPIYPVYIKRRKHFYSRLEAGIGSPIDVNQYKKGAIATPEEIEFVCKLVEEKERELEAFVLKK